MNKPDVGQSPSTRRVRDPAEQRRSTCPVACTLDIVGDRWPLLLVRDLLRGKARYSQFLESAEHIPTNILADRLKRLEREGLITSTAYSEHPRRLEYRLTDDGRSLGRAVGALAAWGLEHIPGTVQPDLLAPTSSS